MIDFLTTYWVLFTLLTIGLLVASLYEMYRGGKMLVSWVKGIQQDGLSNDSFRSGLASKTSFIPTAAVYSLACGVCLALAVVGIFTS